MFKRDYSESQQSLDFSSSPFKAVTLWSTAQFPALLFQSCFAQLDFHLILFVKTATQQPKFYLGESMGANRLGDEQRLHWCGQKKKTPWDMATV